MLFLCPRRPPRSVKGRSTTASGLRTCDVASAPSSKKLFTVFFSAIGITATTRKSLASPLSILIAKQGVIESADLFLRLSGPGNLWEEALISKLEAIDLLGIDIRDPDGILLQLLAVPHVARLQLPEPRTGRPSRAKPKEDSESHHQDRHARQADEQNVRSWKSDQQQKPHPVEGPVDFA